jgi:hypothetical protein
MNIRFAPIPLSLIRRGSDPSGAMCCATSTAAGDHDRQARSGHDPADARHRCDRPPFKAARVALPPNVRDASAT